ncbi:LytTR family transcriptional regulator DNA-binding domain-containing protein [Pedobacter fastidiosus]|uniref:LytTR family transcriptional regulator DNA-binding domain-containing protein n=1 Tax=Pedobacter fastidiosus TaxID=2765361 RepID=UPI00361FD500
MSPREGQVITKYSMVALEAMLPSSNFVRIHRSYIIAIDQLRSYTTITFSLVQQNCLLVNSTNGKFLIP